MCVLRVSRLRVVFIVSVTRLQSSPRVKCFVFIRLAWRNVRVFPRTLRACVVVRVMRLLLDSFGAPFCYIHQAVVSYRRRVPSCCLGRDVHLQWS